MYACLKISFEEDLKMYLLKVIYAFAVQNKSLIKVSIHIEKLNQDFVVVKDVSCLELNIKTWNWQIHIFETPKKQNLLKWGTPTSAWRSLLKTCVTVFLGHACNSIWLELGGLAWLEIDGQVALLPSPSGIYHRQACWLD